MLITDKEEIKWLKKNLNNEEAIVTFRIWKDKTVGIEMDQHWDLDVTADYFVDWFKYGCIYSLFELGCSLCWDDDLSKVGIIKDFLEQLKALSRHELGDKVKDEDEVEDEEIDKDTTIKDFKGLIKWYFKK